MVTVTTITATTTITTTTTISIFDQFFGFVEDVMTWPRLFER